MVLTDGGVSTVLGFMIFEYGVGTTRGSSVRTKSNGREQGGLSKYRKPDFTTVLL